MSRSPHLPADVPTLQEWVPARDQIISQLRLELSRLKRWQYGQSSEQFDVIDQVQRALDDLGAEPAPGSAEILPAMTVTSFRIYYNPDNAEFGDHLTKTHWGFALWFEHRLKPIREQLRGPEAKGVNIVNLMLYDNPTKAWRLGEWGKRANSFEYDLLFDFAELGGHEPVENIPHLMHVAERICATAPWPQVVAISEALRSPLSSEDTASLRPFLAWPRPSGIAS